MHKAIKFISYEDDNRICGECGELATCRLVTIIYEASKSAWICPVCRNHLRGHWRYKKDLNFKSHLPLKEAQE